MELAPADAQHLAFYAGAAGLIAGFGLVRDRRAHVAAPAGREGLIAPLGLAALGLAMAAGASRSMTFLAGALLLSGLALLAVAPRRPERRSPGRRVGSALGWASVAAALAGAFIPAVSAPPLAT